MKKKEKTHGATAPAAIFMAVLIVASVPLGVNRSFARLRDDVHDEYYYDSTGYALWDGIDTCESIAKNLVTVAKNYTEQYPQLAKPVADLEYCTKVSENTYEFDDESFWAIASAHTELTNAAHTLYDALEEVELSEKDAKYPRELMAELDAECDKIKRSSYNDEAEKYNEKLSNFPASALRKIANVDYMATFDEESSADVSE